MPRLAPGVPDATGPERFPGALARQDRTIEVLPTSEKALREGLQREMNVLPPCRFYEVKENGSPVKIGGSDAAIWLTAVEYAPEHPAGVALSLVRMVVGRRE